MVSITKVANCIGISGNFSLKHDFFGYTTGTVGVPSVLTQVRLLQGPHIHLNLIEVGSVFNGTDELYNDIALELMRTIYATVQIGVGRVEYYVIPPPAGHDSIASDSEAETLMSKWVVDNVGIDVFIVHDYLDPAGHAGLSPISGTCNKHDKGMKGCVTCPTQNITTLGHEVGHYLGLVHVNSPNNLMNPTGGAKLDSFESSVDPDTGLVTEVPQGDIMKTHCSIRAGCTV